MILDHIEKFVSGEHLHSVVVRRHLTETTQRFIDSGLADPKFITELASASEQTFWACMSEVLVADVLQGISFAERKKIGNGPDFLLRNGDQKIWIEVICPSPSGIRVDWLQKQMGTVINFPHKEVLLRWTSAVKEKAEN
jgi:hypothetical protein